MPKATLISPIYNAQYFDQVLQTYGWQDCNKDDFEIIFILTNKDNWNEVGEKIIEFRKKMDMTIYYHLAPFSNCEARNQGAILARSELLIFADGDQLLSPNLVSEHIENTTYGIIGLGIVNIDIFGNPDSFGCRVPWLKGQPDPLWIQLAKVNLLDFTKGLYPHQAMGLSAWHNPDNLNDYVNFVTRNCSMTKQDFNEIGGFDENMGYSPYSQSRGWEDIEFGIRAYEKGKIFKVVPCWAVHIEHTKMDKDRGWQNVIKLAKKHPWFLDQRPDWFRRRYGDKIEEIKRIVGNNALD